MHIDSKLFRSIHEILFPSSYFASLSSFCFLFFARALLKCLLPILLFQSNYFLSMSFLFILSIKHVFFSLLTHCVFFSSFKTNAIYAFNSEPLHQLNRNICSISYTTKHKIYIYIYEMLSN